MKRVLFAAALAVASSAHATEPHLLAPVEGFSSGPAVSVEEQMQACHADLRRAESDRTYLETLLLSVGASESQCVFDLEAERKNLAQCEANYAQMFTNYRETNELYADCQYRQNQHATEIAAVVTRAEKAESAVRWYDRTLRDERRELRTLRSIVAWCRRFRRC